MTGHRDRYLDDPPSPGLDLAYELVARGPRKAEPRGARRRLVAMLRQRLAEGLRPQLAHSREVDGALADVVAQLRDHVRTSELAGAMRDREGAERTTELTETVWREMHGALADLDRTLRAQVRAVLHTRPYVVDTRLSQFDSPVGSVVGYESSDAFRRDDAPDHGDLRRQSPEMERDLLAPYIVLLEGHAPVVDLACGAGDLVTELTAAGIRAEGIADDPLDQLAAHADGSLGAVFSSGLIERLAVTSQWRLLETAFRALRPGGLFIAETHNPHSVSAMRLLTMGEADQHPAFPEVALGMCGLTGFAPAFVFAPGYPSFESARFGAPRFAVVATRPNASASADGPD